MSKWERESEREREIVRKRVRELVSVVYIQSEKERELVPACMCRESVWERRRRERKGERETPRFCADIGCYRDETWSAWFFFFYFLSLLLMVLFRRKKNSRNQKKKVSKTRVPWRCATHSAPTMTSSLNNWTAVEPSEKTRSCSAENLW